MSDKIVQRMYVKLNPDTSRIMTSCTLMDGYTVIYVSNYPGTQQELAKDYKELNS
jgi:hypothetical protein